MLLVDNIQNKIEIEESFVKIIEEIIDFALKDENFSKDYELSLIFVDNNKIREINRDFRKVDKETDVLSFPMLEYPEGRVFKECDLKFDYSFYNEGKIVLGDIAISLEKALEQSKEFGHSFQRETAYLTIHSILHLLGYDHMVELDKDKMRKREEEILEKFNLIR